jgi:NTP pyrophosphatase (non-canonical NTP hydrolase)
MKITTEQLDHWFKYHQHNDPKIREAYSTINGWYNACNGLIQAVYNGNTEITYDHVTTFLRQYAGVIVEHAPPSADTTAAIRCLRLVRNALNEYLRLIERVQAQTEPIFSDSYLATQRAVLLGLAADELIKVKWQANPRRRGLLFFVRHAGRQPGQLVRHHPVDVRRRRLPPGRPVLRVRAGRRVHRLRALLSRRVPARGVHRGPGDRLHGGGPVKEQIVNGITLLVQEAHGNSRDHGFWDEQRGDCFPDQRAPLDEKLVLKTIPEKLALIHSEVSEALEDYRRGPAYMGEHTTETGKPVGFDSELADIVIRVADLAGALNIDLGGAILRKLEYNRSRPYKHGKVC